MSGFDSLDNDFAAVPMPGESRKRAEITPDQFAALSAPHVPCGFLTLTLTDGSQKRFRIRLERGTFLTGHRTLSRYCKIESNDGDHEREWESIATVGSGGFLVFKRWRGEWEERWAIAIWMLLNKLPADGYKVEVEPRCWLCLRELKNDAQRASGLTPGCAKKLGIKI